MGRGIRVIAVEMFLALMFLTLGSAPVLAGQEEEIKEYCTQLGSKEDAQRDEAIVALVKK
jgi:hypothetical protein